MSISPPSDIVLDVVNAANPAKYATAAKRLQTLAQLKTTGASSDFSKTLQAAVGLARSQPAKTFHAAEAKINAANDEALVAAKRLKQQNADNELRKAHQKLEGVFLQGIIKTMLSAQKDKLYGDGIAGDYWKSFMAEAVANQIAKGRGIGVADSLMRQPAVKKSLTGALNSATLSNTTDYKQFFQKLFLDETTKSSAS